MYIDDGPQHDHDLCEDTITNKIVKIVLLILKCKKSKY